MSRVLLVTVGGSPEPVLHAVRNHNPDEVIFIPSVKPTLRPSLDQVIGEGTPCRHELPDGVVEIRPNLVVQLGLQESFDPERHLIGIPDPDNLGDAYKRIRSTCRNLQGSGGRHHLIGDYTGGTKTMSTALVMACVELDAELSLVTGPRDNLSKVTNQSEGTRAINIGPLRAVRILQERLPELLAVHAYDQAALSIGLLRTSLGESLPPWAADAADQLLENLNILDTWERFRWNDALVRAKRTTLATSFPELIEWWERVWVSRSWLKTSSIDIGVATGYELVQDLLLNADRKGTRGLYDDAVARIYRALELLGQSYVQFELGTTENSTWNRGQCFLKTGEQVPTGSLKELYDWLERNDTKNVLVPQYLRQRDRLSQLRHARNQSLMAHGLIPVKKAQWRSFQDGVEQLVDAVLHSPGFSQGPPPQQLPGTALLQLPEAQVLLGMAG